MGARDIFPRVTVAEWRRRAVGDEGRETLETPTRQTRDGLTLQALYTAEDRPEVLWPPFEVSRRGPAVCPPVEVPDPRQAGRQVTEHLGAGADGIWLRLGRAARLGPDFVAEPAGPGGVASDAAPLEGVEVLHGTDLALALGEGALGEGALDGAAGCSLWLEAGANALPWAALWLADCERRGRAPAAVVVHFGADPLAALAADGALPRDLMKLGSEMAALARFCAGRLPGSTALTVSTAVYHEAGATAADELGFMVATLREYLRRLGDSGLAAGEAAPLISLRCAVGQQVFPEIAKLRAAHYLWRAALGAAGVVDPPPARLHVVGARRGLSRRQPELNLLRGCEQGFAAFCGGAEAVSLRELDGAAGSRPEIPAALARRLARNTALILRHEGCLDRVADPAAGSFLVEALTRRLASEGWERAQEIERRGGMLEAVTTGEVARRVAAAARRRRQTFTSGRAAITGVTHFVLDAAAGDASERPAARAAAAAERRQGRLEQHRATWSAPRRETSYSRDFVVEELLSLARRGATLAELGERLGGTEGAERSVPLAPRRDAAPFEAPPESGDGAADPGEEE